MIRHQNAQPSRSARRCAFSALLVVCSAAFVATPRAGAATSSEVATLEVRAAGITVDYPRTWTVMPRTQSELRHQMRQLRTKEPELARLVDENARLDLQPSTLKARVQDIRGYLAGAGMGNIRVYRHPDHPFAQTLEDYTATFGLMESLSNVTVERATALRVDGERQAYRVDLRLSEQGTELRATWLTLPYRDGDVSVHITISKPDEAREALIDRIVDGVHLK
jgi:hypothetical protein